MGFRVELRGFEPLTPSMRTRCATGLRYSPWTATKANRRTEGDANQIRGESDHHNCRAVGAWRCSAGHSCRAVAAILGSREPEGVRGQEGPGAVRGA
jgi:hypothetical protein